MTKAKKPAARVKAGQSKESADSRRNLFVEAYLSNNGNTTQAALAAGFAPKSAASQGSRLLKNAKVLTLIDSRRTAVFDNLKITTERILLERARLAFFDPTKLYDKFGKRIPVHLLDQDTAAAIQGVEHDRYGGIKIKLASKDASLTSLERQRGMYRADNEQKPPEAFNPDDMIVAARALAFTFARAARAVKGKK